MLAGSGAHGVRCLLRIALISQAFGHVFVDPQRSWACPGRIIFDADRRLLGEKSLAICRKHHRWMR